GTPENPNGIAPLPLVPISAANPAGSTPIQIVGWQYEYAWPQDCVRLRQVKQPLNQPNQGLVAPLWPDVNMNSPALSAMLGDLGQRVNYQLALDADATGTPI